eukprot:TRINITY_DN9384_c0_g1_i1.p1 TRINITY_DN9384_c0_g1~~TRINITY_DN9384_c0_g1_i1.p1  ORF type:complete len:326 (+),score=58.43 TRINITY_DN9384_c0_g1_i1:96-1073(+)
MDSSWLAMAGATVGAVGAHALWRAVFAEKPRRGDGLACVVTGAASGIGRATALRMSALGWTVLGVDISEGGLAELQKAAPGSSTIRTLRCDLTAPESASAVVAAVKALGVPLGCLINAAGMLSGAPVAGDSDESMLKLLGVNLLAPVRLTRDLIPLLVAAPGGGTVVHVGSISGRVAFPWTGLYSASKHAIEGMSDQMRCEALAAGLPLRVTVVQPGPVDTPLANALPDLQSRWCDANPSSVFHGALKKSAAVNKERASSSGPKRALELALAVHTPDEVAEFVVTAATSSAPKARYLATKKVTTLLVHVLQRMPTTWVDMLASKL